MTPKETISHLCDVYTHVLDQVAGRQAGWGVYKTPDTLDQLMADFDSLRSSAVNAALGAENAENLATDYIILHDAYHVGQLCAARSASEPEWDMYAIYK